MNMNLNLLEKTPLKYGWSIAAVGASFFLSGASVNLSQPAPAIDEAPHYLPAQQRFQARQAYEQKFVKDNCPDLKNGNPDDRYDICWGRLSPQQQDRELEKLGKYLQ